MLRRSPTTHTLPEKHKTLSLRMCLGIRLTLLFLPPPFFPQGASDEAREEQLFDAGCLKLMNEYFYGVRIFPGQDPAHVYIGWVTTQYHIHDTAFDQNKVRSVIVQEYTEEGHIKSA